MTHPFLVSIILIKIPNEPEFDIAIGMVGANDSIGEFITTPFAEGIEEAFEYYQEEPPFEDFWKKELMEIPMVESVIVDKYFNHINQVDSPFFFSEPFVIDDVALSPIIAVTHAGLKARRFKVSTERRFEHLMSG